MPVHPQFFITAGTFFHTMSMGGGGYFGYDKSICKAGILYCAGDSDSGNQPVWRFIYWKNPETSREEIKGD